MKRLAVPVLVALVLLSCAHREALLRQRAAFDLQCDEALTVLDLDAYTRGVRGCERQATYVWACGPASPCTWLMNADQRSVQPVAQPALRPPASPPDQAAPVAPLPQPQVPPAPQPPG